MNCLRIVFGGLGTETHSLTESTGPFTLSLNGQSQIWMTTLIVAAAKSLQSCPTLCKPIDGSPPDFPAPGILQARTLEWVAICFSNAWKWKVKGKSLSSVRLFATPWTAAYQAPPSMGFFRQEYWSRVLVSMILITLLLYAKLLQ